MPEGWGKPSRKCLPDRAKIIEQVDGGGRAWWLIRPTRTLLTQKVPWRRLISQKVQKTLRKLQDEELAAPEGQKVDTPETATDPEPNSKLDEQYPVVNPNPRIPNRLKGRFIKALKEENPRRANTKGHE